MLQNCIVNKNLRGNLATHMAKEVDTGEADDVKTQESILIFRMKFLLLLIFERNVNGFTILKKAKQDWWLLVYSS